MVKRALEILTDDPNRIKPFLTDLYNPVMCAIVGFGIACSINWGTRRPLFSGLFSFINIVIRKLCKLPIYFFLGIQKHVAFVVGGGILGKTLDGWRNEHYAEKDAVLRHYVETHPEDFPDPGMSLCKRQKYRPVNFSVLKF